MIAALVLDARVVVPVFAVVFAAVLLWPVWLRLLALWVEDDDALGTVDEETRLRIVEARRREERALERKGEFGDTSGDLPQAGFR